MQLLFTFLQGEGAAAAATSGGGGIFGGGSSGLLIMMLLLFVVMYFFMMRPQQKKQKELRKMREELQRGDKVITAGGIYGTIVEVNNNYVLIEIDNNVKIRIDKSAIYKDNSDIQQK